MDDAKVASEIIQRPREGQLALRHVPPHRDVDPVVDHTRRRSTSAAVLLHRSRRRPPRHDPKQGE